MDLLIGQVFIKNILILGSSLSGILARNLN